MKKVVMDEVFSKKLIMTVADFADEIWHEHYDEMLADGQVDYMVRKYQSEEAIEKQISEGYKYFLVKVDGEYAGYIALRADMDARKLFISKAYLLREFRGKGIFSEMIRYVNTMAENMGCNTLWLTVNRGNTDSIQVYEHIGFFKVRKEDSPIGNGYVMNDYVMEYKVSNQPELI